LITVFIIREPAPVPKIANIKPQIKNLPSNEGKVKRLIKPPMKNRTAKTIPNIKIDSGSAIISK